MCQTVIKKECIAVSKGYCTTHSGHVMYKKKIVKGRLNKNGYKYISFRHNGKMFSLAIHRLVAFEKFGEDIFVKGMEVRHKDGDRTNNSHDNILIGTRSDNMMDIPKEIRVRSAINASRKIVKYDKKVLHDMRESGLTYKEITEKTGATNRAISYAHQTYTNGQV